MMQPVRYPVKLSTALRVFYIGIGVLCLSMAADSAGADAKTQILAWAFFGLGGVLVLKLMLRNIGWLILREDGLVVDTHWSTGFIRWEDLHSPKQVRVWGMSYLGLSTTDPDAYLKSREQLRNLENAADRVFTQGFLRGMIAMLSFLPPAKTAVNVGMTLCGWSPLPKSTTEADMMDWQGKNYGAQIILHRLWIPDFDRVLKDLQSRARGCADMTKLSAGTTKAATGAEPFRPRIHEPQDQTPPPARDVKTCPMCAEEIQQQARICRFCRYSFEEQRLLPSA